MSDSIEDKITRVTFGRGSIKEGAEVTAYINDLRSRLGTSVEDFDRAMLRLREAQAEVRSLKEKLMDGKGHICAIDHEHRGCAWCRAEAAESRLHQLSEDHSHCEGLLHELGERASRAESRLEAYRTRSIERDKFGGLCRICKGSWSVHRGAEWHEADCPNYTQVERGSTIEAGPECGDAIRRVIEIEQATKPKSE